MNGLFDGLSILRKGLDPVETMKNFNPSAFANCNSNGKC